jgi:hypothetical protein
MKPRDVARRKNRADSKISKPQSMTPSAVKARKLRALHPPTKEHKAAEVARIRAYNARKCVAKETGQAMVHLEGVGGAPARTYPEIYAATARYKIVHGPKSEGGTGELTTTADGFTCLAKHVKDHKSGRCAAWWGEDGGAGCPASLARLNLAVYWKDACASSTSSSLDTLEVANRVAAELGYNMNKKSISSSK